MGPKFPAGLELEPDTYVTSNGARVVGVDTGPNIQIGDGTVGVQINSSTLAVSDPAGAPGTLGRIVAILEQLRVGVASAGVTLGTFISFGNVIGFITLLDENGDQVGVIPIYDQINLNI